MFYIDNVFSLLYLLREHIYAQNLESTFIHNNPQVIHYP